MKSFLNRAFLIGTIDRAVKSFGQGIVAVLGLEQFNAFELNWSDTLGVACGFTVLSIATSLASVKVGDEGTSSFLRGGR